MAFLLNIKAMTQRYIVHLRQTVTREDIIAELKILGIEIPYIFIAKDSHFTAVLTPEQYSALEADNRVLRIDVDHQISLNTIENIPIGLNQNNGLWALDRIDQRNLPLNGQFEYSKYGQNVDVYMIDSGILYTHVEFQGRAQQLPGFDAFNDGGIDAYGHGTGTASCVGGINCGVAKTTNLYAAKIFESSSGLESTFMDACAAIINHHQTKTTNYPSIVNMSLSFGVRISTVNYAVRQMVDAGIICVNSAGNYGTNGLPFADSSYLSPQSMQLDFITIVKLVNQNPGATDTVQFFVGQNPNANYAIPLSTPVEYTGSINTWVQAICNAINSTIGGQRSNDNTITQLFQAYYIDPSNPDSSNSLMAEYYGIVDNFSFVIVSSLASKWSDINLEVSWKYGTGNNISLDNSTINFEITTDHVNAKLIVVGATDITYPSVPATVIPAGSPVPPYDNIAYYSNYGSLVTVFAPGTNVQIATIPTWQITLGYTSNTISYNSIVRNKINGLYVIATLYISVEGVLYPTSLVTQPSCTSFSVVCSNQSNNASINVVDSNNNQITANSLTWDSKNSRYYVNVCTTSLSASVTSIKIITSVNGNNYVSVSAQPFTINITTNSVQLTVPLTTILPAQVVNGDANQYSIESGTSFSSPYTAGVVALYLQGTTKNQLSPLNVYNWIIQNSTPNIVYGLNSTTPNRMLYSVFTNETLEWVTAPNLGEINEQQTIQIVLQAISTAPTTIQYTSTNLPSWLSLNGNILSGQAPTVVQNTTFTFDITANDGENFLDQTFTLLVVYVASPPFWAIPTTDSITFTVNEKTAITPYVVSIIDNDGNNVEIFELPQDWPSWLTLTVNGTTAYSNPAYPNAKEFTATITGTTPQYSANGNNTYQAVVRGTDNINSETDRTIIFDVQQLPIIPPVWSTPIPATTLTLTSNTYEGSFFSGIYFNLTLQSSDASDLPVTYVLTENSLPPGLTLNPVTGQLSGILGQVLADTTYPFTLSLSDGTNLVPQNFSITIKNTVSDAVPIWITPAGNIGSFVSSVLVHFSFTASDPLNRQLTYGLISGTLPPGLTLNNNGAISGTPALVLISTSYTFSVSISAQGGSYPASRQFSITILPETISPISWVYPVLTPPLTFLGYIGEEDSSILYIEASSSSGDTLNYAIGSTLSNISPTPPTNYLPPALTIGVSNNQCLIMGNPELIDSDTTYNFYLQAYSVSNPASMSIIENFSFTVKNNYVGAYMNINIPLTGKNHLDWLTWNTSSLISDTYLYRIIDSNFGRVTVPSLYIISGVNNVSMDTFTDIMQNNYVPSTLYMGNLASITVTDLNQNSLYDLLYIPLVDKNSAVNTYRNQVIADLGYNRNYYQFTIVTDIIGNGDFTISINNVTYTLPASGNITTDTNNIIAYFNANPISNVYIVNYSDVITVNGIVTNASFTVGLGGNVVTSKTVIGGEILPLWMPTYQSLLPVAYVEQGTGSNILQSIQQQGLDTVFNGRSFDITGFEVSVINYGGRGTRTDTFLPFPD